jgi:hypothetical protein
MAFSSSGSSFHCLEIILAMVAVVSCVEMVVAVVVVVWEEASHR